MEVKENFYGASLREALIPLKLLVWLLLAGLLSAGCKEDDIVAVYSFNESCSVADTGYICQPCDFCGAVRRNALVDFIDSATGDVVTLTVNSASTYVGSKTDKPRKQVQLCYYKAFGIPPVQSSFEVSGNAEYAEFSTIWSGHLIGFPLEAIFPLPEGSIQVDGQSFLIGRIGLRSRTWMPRPLAQPARLMNIAPRERQSYIKEAWMAEGLGLVRLVVVHPKTGRLVLQKRYGY